MRSCLSIIWQRTHLDANQMALIGAYLLFLRVDNLQYVRIQTTCPIIVLTCFPVMLRSWAEEDVDPSLFPRELLANASNFVEDEEVASHDQYRFMRMILLNLIIWFPDIFLCYNLDICFLFLFIFCRKSIRLLLCMCCCLLMNMLNIGGFGRLTMTLRFL